MLLDYNHQAFLLTALGGISATLCAGGALRNTYKKQHPALRVGPQNTGSAPFINVIIIQKNHVFNHSRFNMEQ